MNLNLEEMYITTEEMNALNKKVIGYGFQNLKGTAKQVYYANGVRSTICRCLSKKLEICYNRYKKSNNDILTVENDYKNIKEVLKKVILKIDSQFLEAVGYIILKNETGLCANSTTFISILKKYSHLDIELFSNLIDYYSIKYS